MSQKSLIQLMLVLLIIVISTSVYLTYFGKKNENLKTNTKVIKIENKIVKNSDYIKNINYISELGGNKYQITAKRARIEMDTPDLMYLKNIVAYITIKDSEIIKVTSNFGEYNSINYDTIFSENVVVTYPDHKITGEHLNFSFVNNIGVFSTNIIYAGNKTKMFADKVEIDLITNNTKIFMIDNSEKVLIERVN
tara:strand:- start:504 stop:1085 length:582 start_codon:yes stop_codon:yes gene_type:complete